MSLNESPSEKEGKYRTRTPQRQALRPLNESPSEKEGKFWVLTLTVLTITALNESPSEKEGKCALSLYRLGSVLNPQ